MMFLSCYETSFFNSMHWLWVTDVLMIKPILNISPYISNDPYNYICKCNNCFCFFLVLFNTVDSSVSIRVQSITHKPIHRSRDKLDKISGMQYSLWRVFLKNFLLGWSGKNLPKLILWYFDLLLDLTNFI